MGQGLSRRALGPRQGRCYAGRERRAGGPSAFVMLELFLNTLRHSPGSRASQLALSCLRISPARPIFPLLSLAPVKEPAPGFVCFNPPCAKLLPLCGVPGFGGRSVRVALVSPSHQLSLGDVFPLRHEFLQRCPSGSFLSLPAIRNAPLVDPSLLPLGASALLRAVTGYRHRSPEDTGLPGRCHCWPSRGWHWASPGLCQPVQRRDVSLWRPVPECCSKEGASRSLSVISFGSQPCSGWAAAGTAPSCSV